MPATVMTGLGAANPSASKIPTFTIASIGLPAAKSTLAFGISPKGNIVGCSAISTRPCVAFLVTKTGTHNLGLPKGATSSYAYAANDSGVVVGNAERSNSSPPYVVTRQARKYVWKTLHGLNEAAINGEADGINDHGRVVGDSESGMSESRAEWTAGSYVFSAPDLPKASTSNLTGIDAKGDVIGSADSTAYLWLPAGGFDALQPPAGGKYSTGQAIAESSAHPTVLLAAGQSENNVGQFTPLMWRVPASGSGRNVKAVPLPELPGSGNGDAEAVNATGWVVGSSSARACLWVRGHVYDLNNLIPSHSDWQLESAVGVDSAGQIVGDGTHKGLQTAFELTQKR